MQFNNLSVVEFNNIVKNIFDAEEMLFNCAVVGEISAFKITNNIAYFTIKDEYAVLSCIWFMPSKSYNIGEKVKVIGRPNYYVKGGKLNFSVNFIESFGEGEIFKKFQLLKEKLRMEGYFYNKKEMPNVVNNIGVVTSSKGAVIKDIISVATRRNPNINIFVYPVKVQGIDAEKEISKGIEFFNNFNVDVIIIARGGGSSEDLDAFNSEIVSSSCFKSSKFTISAVGHETDYTLLDLVADIRASTPSVAAEIAVKESKNYLFELEGLKYRIDNIIKQKTQSMHSTVHSYANTLNAQLNTKLVKNYNNIKLLSKSIVSAVELKLTKTNSLLEALKLQMLNLNPISLLEKGYALVVKDKIKQKNLKNIEINDEIEVIMKNEKILTKVLKKEKL